MKSSRLLGFLFTVLLIIISLAITVIIPLFLLQRSPIRTRTYDNLSHNPFMIDSRKRFSKTADIYGRYRPSYSSELITWIIKTAGLKPGSTIVDVGCGTGISTRLF